MTQSICDLALSFGEGGDGEKVRSEKIREREGGATRGDAR